MTILKRCLRIVVGLALLTYLFYEHDVKLLDVAHRALDLPLSLVLGAIALDLIGQSLSAFRWSRVARLAGHTVRFKTIWPIYFSGMFFNTCLPTSVGGDVVRGVVLGRRIKSKSVGFTSVFMDRNIGMAALLTVGLVSALAWSGTSIQATFFEYPLIVPLWLLFIPLVGGYVVANLVLFDERTYVLVDRLILRRCPQKVKEKVGKLHRALQDYRRPVMSYGKVYGLSLIYHFSEVTMVWLLAWGFGLHLPFWIFGALVTFQAVAGLLPITINNIGVREGIFCAVLMGQAHLLGIAADQIKDEALALSLVYFGIIVLSGLIGGVVYMVSGISRAAEVAKTDPEEAALDLTASAVVETPFSGR